MNGLPVFWMHNNFESNDFPNYTCTNVCVCTNGIVTIINVFDTETWNYTNLYFSSSRVINAEWFWSDQDFVQHVPSASSCQDLQYYTYDREDLVLAGCSCDHDFFLDAYGSCVDSHECTRFDEYKDVYKDEFTRRGYAKWWVMFRNSACQCCLSVIFFK